MSQISADDLEAARKREEQEFHDTRERDRKTMTAEEFERKYPNKKWYAIEGKIKDALDAIMKTYPEGSTFMDLGCGLGAQSVMAARNGFGVSGIDISPESVEETKAALAKEGYSGDIRVMDAENLEFADNSFDLIVCSGVLHHMDVNAVFPEMARVLKPGGEVVAIEALGYNPAIRAYRRLTPKLRTAWEPDHIITFKELNLARNNFGKIETRNFFLLSIIAVFFRKTFLFKPVLAVLDALDNVILRIPGLKHMSWQILVRFKEPKKD